MSRLVQTREHGQLHAALEQSQRKASHLQVLKHELFLAVQWS